jgi:adenosine kinase
MDAIIGAHPPDVVIVGPDEPAAMLRHAVACRRRGVPFAADPSQQLARMSAEQILQFIQGADYLLTNEYELSLLRSKVGLSDEGLLDLVGLRVTTLGAQGVCIAGRHFGQREIGAAEVHAATDPTGVGDAFRAGFFTGLSWGLPLDTAARMGCQLAAEVLETVGTQEYRVDPVRFRDRLARS